MADKNTLEWENGRLTEGGRPDPRDVYTEGPLPHTAISWTLDLIVRKIGDWASWLWAILVLIIVGNVVLRYAFGEGRVELEELQWHLYSFGFLIGLSYTMVSDGHVRVDIFHMKFRPRTKAWIEMLGILLFLFPFVALVLIYGVPFVIQAYELMEGSDAPGGLPYRWIVKSALVIGFALLAIAAFSRLTRATALLFGFPKPYRPRRTD
jgi:TRAP-type mannitol/chloroaromatic compound transport system permease small subunit